jgi:hypothetical protein
LFSFYFILFVFYYFFVLFVFIWFYCFLLFTKLQKEIQCSTVNSNLHHQSLPGHRLLPAHQFSAVTASSLVPLGLTPPGAAAPLSSADSLPAVGMLPVVSASFQWPPGLRSRISNTNGPCASMNRSPHIFPNRTPSNRVFRPGGPYT